MAPSEFDQATSIVRAHVNEHLQKFGADISNRFAGNEVYDFAVEELKGLDWDAGDLEAAKEAALAITNKARSAGVSYMSDLLGKAMVTWAGAMAVGAGYVGGAALLPAAAITAGVGAALNWGLDSLIDMVWPKGDEQYAPGDMVVINREKIKGGGGSAWRRRMPALEGGLNIGMVTSPSDGQYVSYVDIQNGKQDSVPVEDVARIPKDSQAEIERGSPVLGNMATLMREVTKGMHQGKALYKPKHSVRVGDKILFKGDLYVISKGPHLYNGVQCLLLDNGKGTYIRPPVGDPDITELYNQTTHQPPPNKWQRGFSQSTGFSAGDLVWFPSDSARDTEILGGVAACKANEVGIRSALDGTRHERAVEECTPATELDTGGWMSWIAAVVEGELLKVEQLCPGRTGWPQVCTRQIREIVRFPPTWDDPAEDSSHPVDENFMTYNTNSKARGDDAARMANEVAGNFDTLSVDSDEGEPKKQSNNNVMFILAGAAILAVMLSR